MALVFTSWTALVEDGTPRTLNWGASGSDLAGKVAYRYLTALGRALNERIAWAGPGIGTIADYVRGDDAYDWAVIFEGKVNSLSISGGGAHGKWVDYADSGGDWEGDAINEIPTWDNLADILGEAVITPERGELSRNWAQQRYRALDKMRWYATEEGTFEDVLTSYSKGQFEETTWANAVANFNGASYSGAFFGYKGGHYAIHSFDVGSGDENFELFRFYADVDLSGIAVNISHQLVWYKYVSKAIENIGLPNVNNFEDNDDGATVSTLHKEHTSTIATTATRSGIIIGSNSANNSATEPTKPTGISPDFDHANGYQYGDNGFAHLMLWKLNVDANGLIFVTS